MLSIGFFSLLKLKCAFRINILLLRSSFVKYFYENDFTLVQKTFVLAPHFLCAGGRYCQPPAQMPRICAGGRHKHKSICTRGWNKRPPEQIPYLFWRSFLSTASTN